MRSLTRTFLVYLVLIVALLGSSVELLHYIPKGVAMSDPVTVDDYSQPSLGKDKKWVIKSVDTQVVSKHWPKVTQETVHEQVKLIADLGVNYIAVGTSYDREADLRLWVEEIHRQGMHVWFRSHWANWEGDDGKPATMSADEYIAKTARFIESNPDLFQPGDSFTMAVEPEQVGVGLGQRFLTWDQYRSFILSEILVSNKSFEKINLKGKVYTNWISVNGWVVENAFTDDLVSKLGLITVDHFVGQSNTIGNLENEDEMVKQTLEDLDRFHKRWKVPVLIGEWGYQIFQPVSDERQAEVIDKMYQGFASRDYIVGVNYWVHMGNSASLVGDEYGSNLKYRSAALIIQNYYLNDGKKVLKPVEPVKKLQNNLKITLYN